MKKFYAVFLLYSIAISFSISLAQSVNYGYVLYRVNAGGIGKASQDTSSVSWAVDNANTPSPYVDTVAMGNKTYGTFDSVVSHSSVPSTTPPSVFKTERGLLRWDVNGLEYNFPVASGKKVEVRLYFAEIYFDSAGKRIMDIIIEDDLKLNDYDIFSEVGHDVGVMKSYVVTSDGNIDIDLMRVVQQPKINAIEIIEIDDATVQGIANRNNYNFSAYPNPFKDQISIDLKNIKISSITLLDTYGKIINDLSVEKISNDLKLDLTTYPVGIYYLKIEMENNAIETLRLLKE